MPVGGGSYGSQSVGESVATELKRSAATRVSYDNTKRRAASNPVSGKFGGLKGGPSGGSMNDGGKKRPGRFGQ